MMDLETIYVSFSVKLLITFAVLVFARPGYTELNCDQIMVGKYAHEKEILLENITVPYQLAIDYDTKTLFFSHTTYKNDIKIYVSAFLSLKTKKYKTILEVLGGFANTIDNHKCIVYFGGEHGIYKFDYDTEAATHIAGTDHNIWQLFFKKHVIYTTFPHKNVYMLKDDQTELVTELTDTRAKLVAQNNNLDYYFSNSSGLFKLQKANGNIYSLGSFKPNAITADDYGNLYFSTSGGIYSINEKDKIVIIAAIPGIYGLAIESDRNIIYSTDNRLVRLKPAKNPCKRILGLSQL